MQSYGNQVPSLDHQYDTFKHSNSRILFNENVFLDSRSAHSISSQLPSPIGAERSQQSGTSNSSSKIWLGPTEASDEANSPKTSKPTDSWATAAAVSDAQFQLWNQGHASASARLKKPSIPAGAPVQTYHFDDPEEPKADSNGFNLRHHTSGAVVDRRQKSAEDAQNERILASRPTSSVPHTLSLSNSGLASPPGESWTSTPQGFSLQKKILGIGEIGSEQLQQYSSRKGSTDDQSVLSQPLSEHYATRNPEQLGNKGEVWTERHHPNSLRRAMKDPNARWIEAYAGALTTLSALNPEFYQLPYGARVVNIKTDFSDNILLSIRCGKYAVLEKVARRIMEAWDARKHPSEKVLFLFSVNGGKKYTGVAELIGPWDPDTNIRGWIDNADGLGNVGHFPVTWVFAKDVPYHYFSHLRQAANGNPVSNMWNGMNFSSDIARAVVETYVKTPATSSILGHPRNYQENAHIGLERGSGPRRALRQGRSGRPPVRGNAPEPLNMRNSHRFDNATRSNRFDYVENPPTPTPAGHGMVGRSWPGPPPKFTLPGPSTPVNAQAAAPVHMTVNMTDAQAGIRRNLAQSDQESGLPSMVGGFPHSHPVGSRRNGISYPSVCSNPPGVTDLRSQQPLVTVGQQHNTSSAQQYRDHLSGVPAGIAHAWPGTTQPQPPKHGRMPQLGDPAYQQYGSEAAHLGHSLQSPRQQWPAAPRHIQSGAGGMASETARPNLHIKPMTPGLGGVPLGPPWTPSTCPTIDRTVTCLSEVTNNSIATLQSQSQLKSKLYGLLSEKFELEGYLVEQALSGEMKNYLRSRLSEITARIHAIKQELANNAFTDAESASMSPPTHQGSSDLSGGVTSSSIEGFVSPVYAADGRALRSASRCRSPQYSVASHAQGARRGHGFTPSWDLRMADDIDKLVACSEDSEVQRSYAEVSRRESPVWYKKDAMRPRIDSSIGILPRTTLGE